MQVKLNRHIAGKNGKNDIGNKARKGKLSNNNNNINSNKNGGNIVNNGNSRRFSQRLAAKKIATAAKDLHNASTKADTQELHDVNVSKEGIVYILTNIIFCVS